MLTNHFYHEIIRKTIVSFGTLFNNIEIQHTDKNGKTVSVVKVPVSFNDQLEGTKKGDEIKAWVKLVDFSPSLKRPVVEASELV